MYRVFLILSGIVLGFYFLMNLNSCSSSVPSIELKKEYGFSNKQSITIYVIPTGDTLRDDAYDRVLNLDLQARGYKIVDAIRLVNEHSDKVIGKNHRQIADSLQSKKYLPVTDIYIIASAVWDSAYVLTYYSESRSIHWIYYQFSGMYVPTLTSNVSFFDKSLKETIKSYSTTDTTYIYSENEDSRSLYQEYPWMVIAKQLSRKFEDIPICSIVDTAPAENKLKISLWVDEPYRDAFPDTWKDRLRLRVLYANDILRQQFDIELIISEFIEWDSHFSRSLENSLAKLYQTTVSNPNSLQIGITLDRDLKRNWTSRSKIGLAYLLSNYAVITAQPSFPSVGQDWNSIEEAITLVHEIGHVLGAIHVPDQSSIMYPSSGSLSYEFDIVNRKLIESTKTNFLNEDQRERLKKYSKELVKLKDVPAPNANPILPSMGNVAMQINSRSKFIDDDSVRAFSYLSNILPDSVITLAVIGYCEYKNKHYEKAKNNFTKVLELDPDFAEVQWYLSAVLRKNGDSEQSRFYRDLAKPYAKLWVLDE